MYTYIQIYLYESMDMYIRTDASPGVPMRESKTYAKIYMWIHTHMYVNMYNYVCMHICSIHVYAYVYQYRGITGLIEDPCLGDP